MTAKKTTRQNRHQCARRAARGLLKQGRKPWTCPACGGAVRWKDSANLRHCTACHPPPRRGRPRKPPPES